MRRYPDSETVPPEDDGRDHCGSPFISEGTLGRQRVKFRLRGIRVRRNGEVLADSSAFED